ncbi:MAG TPA: PKD domain-containing protein [Thermoanaerobaculia bacterium]|nr:PKD domain-containing protein [Thermoanaerobaculia bacterium]
MSELEKADRRSRIPACRILFVLAAMVAAREAAADCTLTSTGNLPLPDLGPGLYQTFAGGLYPGGNSTRPPAHEAAGVQIGTNIAPRNAAGGVDLVNGKIVMVSIGMSNANDEFASGSTAFLPRANGDPSKNPKLVIVNGAQSGQDAPQWIDPNAATWTTVDSRLTAAGVTPQQVQVAWVKQAIAHPLTLGSFPTHAQVLQNDIQTIARNLLIRYPNIQIAYFSSRTRAYTNDAATLNPEPFAYESGFSVKWMIENQINGQGNLNFDPGQGTVVAPYLSWGPYIWADGTNPRSDGFTWLCTDTQSDFTHPSTTGIQKVADQLLAFFKTDPTARPWFLRNTVMGSPPTVTANASATSGVAPLTVNFTSSATDSDGTIREYAWTFEDGTYFFSQNPVKTFRVPGTYHARLTVTDSSGNTVTKEIPISVTASTTAMSFYTLAPCRVVDTRGADAPALNAASTRTFPIAGKCGIPVTAGALAVNTTVTQATAAGDLRLFPGGASLPLVSTINYGPGQTRANNGVVALGAAGDVSVRCDQASGAVHVILDVAGYFQ